MSKPIRLTKHTLAEAARELATRDAILASVLDQFGTPPLLRRPANFATLIHIVLEQQVSVEAARGTFNRLRDACDGNVVESAVERFGESGLRSLGFSRQKARYAVKLAVDCTSGEFKINGLSKLGDEDVRKRIVARLGLGDWSADVFLMMGLLRPDILPIGDLALVKGLEELDGRPYDKPDEILARAESWRPYRSVATRMIWQSYVRRRGRDVV
ncbi:MAG: DNA-3-methyladenine glycosylase 2 family protein [Planctomycetota bacterium]